jgi:ABC-type oligopeptide transport system substrate-binding subunit
MKKLVLLLALLLCVGLIWFGAGRRAAATNDGYSKTLREANEQKILLLSVGSEPRTLDPQEAQGVTEHHIIMSMIEGLVAPSIDDQAKVVPGMADR